MSQDMTRKQWISILSFILFVMLIVLLFQSWELAWLITAGLGAHELGHILLVSNFGIRWRLRFNLLGLALLTPKKKREDLSHFNNSRIHLAGSLFSLFFALVAIAIHWLVQSGEGQDFWLRTANFSAQLGLFNALPLGKLSDGGKFAKRLMASLDERQEKNLLWTLLFWPISILWMLWMTGMETVRMLGLFFVGIWLLVQLMIESRLDDPNESESPKAMNGRQAVLLVGLLVAVLVFNSVIALRTPLWLTPEAVQNFVSLFS